MNLCLNGTWEYKDPQGGAGLCTVPGITLDPAQSAPLRLKRRVQLSDVPFTRLFLRLRGARFCPEVWVNGARVARMEGGMCETNCVFDHPDCMPGAESELEIRLCAIEDMPVTDASRIPEADWWRSNLSCCLWDDVLLHPVAETAITRVIPQADEQGVHVRVEADTSAPYRLRVRVENADGRNIAQTFQDGCGAETRVDLPVQLETWSPEHPAVYRVVAAADDGQSELSVPCGLSRFDVQGHGFALNGTPIRLRGTSVCWHRLCRDPEGDGTGNCLPRAGNPCAGISGCGDFAPGCDAYP